MCLWDHVSICMQIGTGLYPLAALANHACNPSCLASYEGTQLCFR
jgi:hypothetical protein